MSQWHSIINYANDDRCKCQDLKWRKLFIDEKSKTGTFSQLRAQKCPLLDYSVVSWHAWDTLPRIGDVKKSYLDTNCKNYSLIVWSIKVPKLSKKKTMFMKKNTVAIIDTARVY